MNLLPQIVFKNVDESQTVVDAIQKELDHLNKFFPKIMGCRVLIESPHNHESRFKRYHVTVKLTVPGRDLIINNDRGKNDSNNDLYVAIRAAFDIATRQLEDYAKLRRGDTKYHEQRNSRIISDEAPATL